MDSSSGGGEFVTPSDGVASNIATEPTPTDVARSGGAGPGRGTKHHLTGVRHGAHVAHDAFSVAADKAGHRDIAAGH
jgi:hypothetical protein